MRRFFLVMLAALLLTGCQDRAEQLFETAQLEEKQFNEEHAAELYRQILEKHPRSAFAPKAKERLDALEGH
jgi:TolA-binding protein